MKILDCTLRDGGYTNEWMFDKSLANKYLESLDNSNIEAIELGFRTPNKNKKCGIFGKLTDEFIFNELYIPLGVKYLGVMIDGKEYDYDTIKREFKYAIDCVYNFVRIATYYKDIENTKILARCLKGLGYIVSINLMQSSLESYENIFKTAQYIQSWNTVDILYIADSLGNMSENDIIYSFEALKKGWDGEIGFHGHNNQNRALSNSLTAVDVYDINYVDSSILGIGRGSGNTPTEYLILELNKRGYGEYNLQSIFEIIPDFYKLKNKYNWGSNIFYYLAGEYNIHPTYIQTMLENEYKYEEIINNIYELKNENKFDKNKIRQNRSWMFNLIFGWTTPTLKG